MHALSSKFAAFQLPVRRRVCARGAFFSRFLMAEMKAVDVGTAHKLLSSGTHKYVDVRTPGEFAGARLPSRERVCAEV